MPNTHGKTGHISYNHHHLVSDTLELYYVVCPRVDYVLVYMNMQL